MEIKDSIKDGARLPIDPSVPKDLSKLTTLCWKQNPKHRPDFSAIIVTLTDNTTKFTPPLTKIFSRLKSRDERHPKVKAPLSEIPLVYKPSFISKYRSRKVYLIAFAFLCLVLISTGVGIFFALNTNRSVSENGAIPQETLTASEIPTNPTLVITGTASTTSILSSNLYAPDSTALSDLSNTTRQSASSIALSLSMGTNSFSRDSTQISSELTLTSVSTTQNEVSSSLSYDGFSASSASASTSQLDLITSNDVSSTLSYVDTSASSNSASSTQLDLTTSGDEFSTTTTLYSDTITAFSDSSITNTEIQTSKDPLSSSTETIIELASTTTMPLASDSSSTTFLMALTTSTFTSSITTTTSARPNYTTIPVVSTFATLGITSSSYRSMAFRKSDNMTFVVDVTYGVIKSISSSGVVSTVVAGGTSAVNGPLNTARFVKPYGIAVNINDLIVTDQTHSIRVINQTDVYTLVGDLSGNSSISVEAPTGVAIDKSGNIYWAQDNGLIKKRDTNGIITDMCGYSGSGHNDGPASDAKFNFPRAIKFGSNNDVFYISDSHYVRTMNMSGYVSTLAGGGSTGSTDGVGLEARFFNPNGLVLDGGGNLIIADSQNHIIRSMDLAT